MLILSRTPGESILIGDDYQIKVLSAEDGKVRFCILSHGNEPVVRSELTKRTTKKNKNEQLASPKDRFIGKV